MSTLESPTPSRQDWLDRQARQQGWLARMFSRLGWGRSDAQPGPRPEPEAQGGEVTEVLSPELMQRIRAIQIRAGHLVDDVMAGEYVSAFKGRGMEFEEVREYQPGDDIRTIDWNVTARMGHPFVKTFREERELTVFLLVDISGSGQFGTLGRSKDEVAAELGAILAYTAIRSNDKVGLLLFTDRVERYIPPKKGRGHVWRVIREILKPRTSRGRTDLGGALDFLNKVHRRRSVCFLISDFLDDGYQRPLRLSRRIHEVIALSISDPHELSLPTIGFLELEDSETGETLLVDTSDPIFVQRFGKGAASRARSRDDLFRAMKVDHIALRADQDTLPPLMRYFRFRERRP